MIRKDWVFAKKTLISILDTICCLRIGGNDDDDDDNCNNDGNNNNIDDSKDNDNDDDNHVHNDDDDDDYDDIQDVNDDNNNNNDSHNDIDKDDDNNNKNNNDCYNDTDKDDDDDDDDTQKQQVPRALNRIKRLPSSPLMSENVQHLLLSRLLLFGGKKIESESNFGGKLESYPPPPHPSVCFVMEKKKKVFISSFDKKGLWRRSLEKKI